MTGFGRAEVKPYFWLIDRGTVGTDMHLAFTVDTREAVRVFYEAALTAGATSREAPAVHPEYHVDYYGAFVDDPARGVRRGYYTDNREDALIMWRDPEPGRPSSA